MRRVTESISFHGLVVVLSAGLLVTGPLGVASAWAQQEGESETSQDVGDDTDDVADEPEASETGEQGEEASAEDGDGDEEEDDESAERLGDALGVSILSVASLIGGVVFLVESGQSSDLADEAGLAGENLRQTDLEDRSDREKALGITLTSLGIVLAGVATWLWIDYVRLNEASSDDTALHLLPSVDPRGGAGFVLGGRF